MLNSKASATYDATLGRRDAGDRVPLSASGSKRGLLSGRTAARRWGGFFPTLLSPRSIRHTRLDPSSRSLPQHPRLPPVVIAPYNDDAGAWSKRCRWGPLAGAKRACLFDVSAFVAHGLRCCSGWLYKRRTTSTCAVFLSAQHSRCARNLFAQPNLRISHGITLYTVTRDHCGVCVLTRRAGFTTAHDASRLQAFPRSLRGLL